MSLGLGERSANTQGIHSRKSKVQKGEGLWLLSMSDMTFILLAFFVLLYSSAKPIQAKFETVQEAVKPPQKRPAPSASEVNLAKISEQVLAEIKKQRLDAFAHVTIDDDGLAIELKDKLLFRSGSAEANPDFATVSDSLLKVIAATPPKYRVTLEGHTDDQAMLPGSPFHSNWELSSARALTVLARLKAKGLAEERMRVVGYGATKPKVPYAEKAGIALQKARAINRRVVIRLD